MRCVTAELVRDVFRLLLLVGRACAIGLPVHCKQYFRCIPSEGNPADAPSRVFDRGKVEDESKVCFNYQNFTVNTDQTLHDETVHPTSDARQSYMSRLSVAPSCSRPCPTAASSVRRHEEAAGGRLNTTENALRLIECASGLQRGSGAWGRETGSHGLGALAPGFCSDAATNRTEALWRAYQDCGGSNLRNNRLATTARRVGPPI